MASPEWPHYRERLTVVDALEAGLCWEGVQRFVLRHGVIAGDPDRYEFADDAPAIRLVVRGDGSGDGDGYGLGSGSWYGFGDGDGNGGGDHAG